jgi:16S rRNA (guanine966-N2)-methyltransferase
VPGLRPTPDRVRETLFNWLQGCIEGARCLDLYAGSGALGFEALSRGAGEVVMVERDARACAALRENAVRLEAGAALTVVHAPAERYLAEALAPFDLVFLDPPFGQGLLAPACAALAARGLLAPGGRVYLEAEARLGEPALPEGWALLRRKVAGEVAYHLAGLSAPD